MLRQHFFVEDDFLCVKCYFMYSVRLFNKTERTQEMIKKYSKEKRKLATEAMELLHLKRRIYEARLSAYEAALRAMKRTCGA